jgi:hypothetical protein
MFDDLDQINWEPFAASSEVSQWIRGLASEDEKIRNDSFDDLLNANIHGWPSFAQYVVIYVLRILEQGEVNSESEVLIEFLRTLRIDAKIHLKEDIAIEASKRIISNIDQSVEVFKILEKNPLTKDAATEILAEIENDPL